MITTEELIDVKNNLSTTRWAFVICVKSAIILAYLTIISYLVFTFLNKNCEGLLGGCATIIGVIVGIPATIKGLQGFEPTNRNIETSNNKTEE